MADQLRYIDDCARAILNYQCLAQHEDYPPWPADDLEAFRETFQDALESCSAGAPLSIFPEVLGSEEMELIYDLVQARIYQLLFAAGLSE